MEKYVTNIKSLVIQALSNGSEIKAKAGKGDALSCFQMGMLCLLGINYKMDFNIAAQYFSYPSLADNQDANCLLGFIAECEGNYSKAFYYYAKPYNNAKDTYLKKIIKGRYNAYVFLKNLDLPATMNTEISKILGDYNSGKVSQLDTNIIIANLCNYELSCYEIALYMYNANNLFSAYYWLQKGNVNKDNPIWGGIKAKYDKLKEELINSKDMIIQEISNQTILPSVNSVSLFSIDALRDNCDRALQVFNTEWKSKCKSIVEKIIEVERKIQFYNDLDKKRKKDQLKITIIVIVTIAIFLIVGFIGMLIERIQG